MENNAAKRKRILIVEDDAFVRRPLRLLLEMYEHTVFEAENGATALDILGREQFDLVILDFRMPGMTGDKIAAQIKEKTPSQPILMITAHVGDLPDLKGIVDAVIEKPFPVEELQKAITGLVCKGSGSR